MTRERNAALEAKSVKELQRLAQTAARRPRRGRNGPSRAAQLHLIDLLSRLGGSGLALIAGICIYLSVTIGQSLPERAGVWAAIVLAALYTSRRFRREFRTGRHIASHPFRWRANYSAALAILGASFGAGAFLLVPTGAGDASLQIFALLLAASISAAALHAAHPNAALALGAPASVMTLASIAVKLGFGITFFASLGISAAAVIAVIYLSRMFIANAALRFPRTSFLRREIDGAGEADHSLHRGDNGDISANVG